MAYSTLELADAFIKAGELDDALEVLNEHLAAHPESETERRLRAEIFMRLSGTDNLLTALHDLTGVDAEDYILRSVILQRLERSQEALSTLDAGYEKFPEHERFLERYIQVLESQGQLHRAKTVIYIYLNGHGQSWRWQQWAGDLCAKLNDYDAAKGHYDLAIEGVHASYDYMTGAIVGIYVRLLLTRADVLAHLGQLGAADADYLQAANLIPGDPMINFNRSLLMARHDLAQAGTLCQQAYDAASAFYKKQMDAALSNFPRLKERITTQPS